MDVKTAVKTEGFGLILPSSSEPLVERINREKMIIAKTNQDQREKSYYESIRRLSRRWFSLGSLDSLSRGELNVLVA